MMIPRLAKALSIIFVLGLLAGCPKAKKIEQFSDLPVPSQFTMVKYESCSLDAATFRMGKWMYKGTKSPEKVIEFYKEEMNKFNWTQTLDKTNYLEFTKPRYGKAISPEDAENNKEKAAITVKEENGQTVLLIFIR